MEPPIRITNTAGPSPESAKTKSRPQCSQAGRSVRKPLNSRPCPQRGQRPRKPRPIGRSPALVRPDVGVSFGKVCAGAPDVDASEEEQPHDVNEVPIPSGELEAEVLLWREVSPERAYQTHDQEDRADDDMGAVEAGRHEESRAVDIAAVVEGGLRILIALHASEGQAERNGQDQAPLEALAIAFEERVMRPGNRGARGK